MIIVDSFVPHTLIKLDEGASLEVVPVEAVVGIFEIKRTLNERSLMGTKKSRGAFEQLKNICEKVGVRKNRAEKYLPGGIMVGKRSNRGFYSNPMVGIIGLDHAQDLIEEWNEFKNMSKSNNNFPPLDIIASINGIMVAPKNPSSRDFICYNLRPKEDSIEFISITDKDFTKGGILSRILPPVYLDTDLG